MQMYSASSEGYTWNLLERPVKDVFFIVPGRETV